MGDTRSPLKEPPLRTPGQSVQDQLVDLAMDRGFLWMMLSAFAIAMAAFEWYRWLAKLQPSPVIFTVAAVALSAVSLYKIRKIRPIIQQYKQGRDGERAVGQFLEELRRDDYQVFHDIPGPNGNVDHVLIGPGGIFVIETKTTSKPRGRESKVVYDGQHVTVDGQAPERDPIAQVKAAAQQIDEIVRRGLGHSVFIRPVILYVRWFTQQPKGSDVWVINEKTLMKWVRNSYKRLTPEEARLASSALDVYVRSYRRE